MVHAILVSASLELSIAMLVSPEARRIMLRPLGPLTFSRLRRYLDGSVA